MSLRDLVSDDEAKTGRSRALFEEAQRVLPGGNTRTTVFIDPDPFYAVRGVGPRIWDADGNERLDFLHRTPEPVVDYRSSRPVDPERPLRAHVGLLIEGILLSRRGMGALSTVMRDGEVDRFVAALDKVLDREEEAR
jgi:glutamate-1-semialdehyde aminotransferase